MENNRLENVLQYPMKRLFGNYVARWVHANHSKRSEEMRIVAMDLKDDVVVKVETAGGIISNTSEQVVIKLEQLSVVLFSFYSYITLWL